MWQTIAKFAVKIALWAVAHPDTIKAIVDDVHAAKSSQ